VNPVTGKAVLGTEYAARTINHQLSVLFGFYEWACAADLGPLMNPVPAQRTRSAGRLNAHHNPMDNFVVHRRATYRQKVPRPAWRAIPDDAADALFSVLRSHRDRALVSFWLSSGARATELLGLCLDTDLDAGANTITVVSKGSRLRETIPASVDSFVWLALYLREECPPVSPGGPLWWTRQGTPRPLTYHAARAVLQRANAAPAAARGPLGAVRGPRDISRPGGVVARRTGTLGTLGGAVPGIAARVESGVEGETPPTVPHSEPDQIPGAAAPAAGGRGGSAPRLVSTSAGGGRPGQPR
jgi:hypothetical protein